MLDDGDLFLGCLLGGVELVGVVDVGVNLNVEFDLRLGAAGTYAHLGAVLGEELEDVAGGGEVHLACGAVLEVVDGEVGIVLEDDEGAAAELLGRVGAEALHHGLNLFGAGLAGTHDGDAFLVAVAVLHVDVAEHLTEVEAAVLGPCADLGHEGDGADGVLVAAEVLGEEAVAFFAAAEVAGGAFELADDAGDPLEAGVAVVHAYVVVLGDGADGLGGDDSLDDVLVAGEASHLAVADHDVVEENHHDLVAVEQLVTAVLGANDCADTVGVRVGGHYEVGVHFLGLGDSHSHSRGVLGVGGVDGGEVAAGDVLFGHVDDVGEAVVAERVGNQFHACAVDGGVHDLEVVVALDDFRVERETLDGFKERLVDFLADDFNLGGVALHLHFLDALDGLDVGDDVDIVGCDDLRAVAPVGLVAVVLLGVVAGRDVYATLAAEMADGIGQLGGGAEVLEEVDLDAVGREHVGYEFGELTGIVAHVVSYHDLDFGQVGEGLLQIVGETLRGGAYRVDVHAVGACAHDASQTARAEFEILVEALDKVGGVFSLEHRLDGGAGFCVIVFGEPKFGLGFNLFEEFSLFFHVCQL